MTIISDNGRGLVHPAYEGLISQIFVPITNSFYEKIKDKDRNILKRYEKILLPKNFFDRLEFAFNDDRRIKFAAVRRVFYEDKIKDLSK